MRYRSTPLLLLTVALAAARAQNADAPPMSLADRALDLELACCTAPSGWNRVDRAELDAMRGGFTEWEAARMEEADEPPMALAERALDIEVICSTAPAGWNRVAVADLDTMRGGFTTDTGLALSLGIERVVSINGEVVSHTNFQIANIANISSAEAQQAHDAINSIQLIQNGANNFAALDPSARGTFVQNTLNGQTIGSQTVINSSVNSLSLMKDLNFLSSIRDAALQGIGTH